METTFYRTLASFDRIPTHHALRKLAQKHGALMHLQLGEICSVVVSSPRLAKEIMKTHDLAFANRTQFRAGEILDYNCLDMVLCEYGGFWRQMRKYACTLELLSAKNVRSFESIRQDEALRLIHRSRLWRLHTRVLWFAEQHLGK
ncbi:premnaspirodiene oxygenase-like [Coffea eugenioides]|uniref:premnaspirodiene oxygenase-like n=1 Tax=Coffea eugenioides TaxID=49369 RepID=UPI000F60E5F5|nr:premnaspirodiene oxygenase-like [Coffea eugenioides]